MFAWLHDCIIKCGCTVDALRYQKQGESFGWRKFRRKFDGDVNKYQISYLFEKFSKFCEVEPEKSLNNHCRAKYHLEGPFAICYCL